MTETIEPRGDSSPTMPDPGSPSPGETINISEEFGTAKRSLPPAATIGLAIVAVILIGGLFAYLQQAKPRATGVIESVNSVQVAGDQLTLAAITLNLKNNSSKPLWIKTVRIEIQAANSGQSADALAGVDFARFFNAFPALKTGAQPPLAPEDRLQPGESVHRTVLAGFRISPEEFAQRKSLGVVILPYDEHVEIVVK